LEDRNIVIRAVGGGELDSDENDEGGEKSPDDAPDTMEREATGVGDEACGLEIETKEDVSYPSKCIGRELICAIGTTSLGHPVLERVEGRRSSDSLEDVAGAPLPRETSATFYARSYKSYL